MDRNERVAQAAQRYVDAGRFAAIEWCVERGARTLTRGRCGRGGPDAQAPIPDAAIYRIFSMTKPIVAVMAMILIEQGKLRLYDLLAAYDLAFRDMRVLRPDGSMQPAERGITVEDLFTHRAGFTYEFIAGCHVAPYYAANRVVGDGSRALGEMMAVVADLPLAFQPGSEFRYSVSTDVLAHVVERAADRPIDELLRQFIFDPLDMADTGFRVPADERDRLMPIYGHGDITATARLTIPPHELVERDIDDWYPVDSPTWARGGHGLYSTLDDYVKFARMLLTGRAPDGRVIISRKMLEMMRANRIPAEQMPLRIGAAELGGYGWGLGMRVMVDVGRARSLTGVGEFGWAGAAATYFWVDPNEDLIGVIMTQFMGSLLPLADDIRTAAYQML